MMKRFLYLLTMNLFLWASPSAQAEGKTPLTQGLRAYQALAFEKAIQWLETSLQQPTLSRQHRLEALRHLAVCYYNQAMLARARATWQAARRLEPQVTLPPGQAPPVHAFFAQIPPPQRAHPQARHAPPFSRQTATLPLGRHSAALQHHTRPPTRPPQARPTSFAARHAISITLLAVGVLAAGAGGISGGLALSFDQQTHQTGSLQTFSALRTSAILSTTLFIAAAALTVSSSIAFLLERL